MKKLLWLDDLRNPHEENWLRYSPLENPFDTTWVKSYDEFTKWINENGLPDAICFDHDLADEHYTPEEYWHDYEVSKRFQDSQNYQEKTGMDCAKWLIDYCIDNEVKLPKWYSQSANPVGRDNINGILTNYIKNCE